MIIVTIARYMILIGWLSLCWTTVAKLHAGTIADVNWLILGLMSMIMLIAWSKRPSFFEKKRGGKT